MEPWPGEHLSISVDDHPAVERGVQIAHVETQLLVHAVVDGGAGLLATLAPLLTAAHVFRFIGCGRGSAGHAPPLTRRVERARETAEQIALQDELFDV